MFQELYANPDDAGLHEETFHLGWATVTQYGWNPYGATVEQTVADFMDVFYGPGSPDMQPVYMDLLEGARFFERGWDVVKSKERGKGYGNSYGKGVGGNRTDEILGQLNARINGYAAINNVPVQGLKEERLED